MWSGVPGADEEIIDTASLCLDTISLCLDTISLCLDIKSIPLLLVSPALRDDPTSSMDMPDKEDRALGNVPGGGTLGIVPGEREGVVAGEVSVVSQVGVLVLLPVKEYKSNNLI